MCPDERPLPFKQVGRYEIVERLYETPWEEVYQAHDPQSGEPVTVKVISPAQSPLVQERLFQSERDTLKTLQHPNILRLVDCGDQGGLLYLVVEAMDGPNLGMVIEERRPLPLAKKLDAIAQVAEGLQFAHQHKVVHRALLPREMVWTSSGKVKLHGFHQQRGGETQADSISTQHVVAEVAYMSPEQARGEKMDARADIFSLGAILYHFVAYEPPFPAPAVTAMLLKIVSAPPEPLEKYLPDAPPKLVEIINKALAKKPKDRYQTAEAFANDLRALLASLQA